MVRVAGPRQRTLCFPKRLVISVVQNKLWEDTTSMNPFRDCFRTSEVCKIMTGVMMCSFVSGANCLLCRSEEAAEASSGLDRCEQMLLLSLWNVPSSKSFHDVEQEQFYRGVFCSTRRIVTHEVDAVTLRYPLQPNRRPASSAWVQFPSPVNRAWLTGTCQWYLDD